VLSLRDVLNELVPTLDVVAGAEGVSIRRVCIDSRQAGADSLFVALEGEQTDGHLYVADAFAAGASVALVARAVPDVSLVDTVRGTISGPVAAPVALVVPDPLQALQALARSRRQARPDLVVVSITGSVGKTTTKDVIASVLAERYVTLKSAGNYNNEIGLPLTLMALEPKHERAVLEMGMYALGEIASLCHIARPQVGVVTNVGPTHLERLGTIERIAQAKAELVQSLPEAVVGGIAILNGDDSRVRGMEALTTARVVTFGMGENAVRATDVVSRGLDGVEFTAHVTGLEDLGVMDATCSLRVNMLGRHAVMSALAAVAVGLVDGLSWEEIAQGLLSLGQGVRLVPKPGIYGSTILDDVYNASPVSTGAALDLLAELPGRHLAVLGDMLELGVYEKEGHRAVGRRCADTLDLLVTVGERARFIAEGAREAGLRPLAVHAMADNKSAIELLSGLLQEGDVLLVKGSRGMTMETIVAALEERG